MMSIKQAFELKNIKCEVITNYEFVLTYNNVRYSLRLANSLNQMFTMFNMETKEQICTRASFKTICRLIKLGHK